MRISLQHSVIATEHSEEYSVTVAPQGPCTDCETQHDASPAFRFRFQPPKAGRSSMDQLQLRLENQVSPVAEHVSALVAVVRPILVGAVYSLKADVVNEAGGYDGVRLRMLPRLYRRGDGDCGICFEYAVHDALARKDSVVTERVSDALINYCKVPGQQISSILFGAEKSGPVKLIETAKDVLTKDSSLLYGSRGRPVKLMKHIDSVAAAFRRHSERLALPHSISGLWKADLFVGNTDSDRWVGTSVKINPHQLEGARGLRVGVVPSRQGRSDAIQKDDQRNLVICPLPYDGAFMEVFYSGWGIVQQFIEADANMPREVALPLPADRTVAKMLVDRRDFPVLEVLDALLPLAQPELLSTMEKYVHIFERRKGTPTIGAAVAPIARKMDA